MKIGRNDPCPCGSGKKYKKCCRELDQAQSEQQATWARVEEARADLPGRLWEFVEERFGPGRFDEAWTEFTLGEEPVFDPESEQIDPFLPWMLYTRWAYTDGVPAPRHDPAGEPAALTYLRERGARLDPLQARYLEAACERPFSFYRVEEATAGAGLTLRDLLTQEVLPVYEDEISGELRAGDLLFAHLVSVEGITVLDGTGAHAIPQEFEPWVTDLAETIRSAVQGPITPEHVAEYDMELVELFQEIEEELLRAEEDEGELAEEEDPEAELANNLDVFIQEHHKQWLDTPIPSLDDRTPREVAAEPGGPARIEALLTLYESWARPDQLPELRPILDRLRRDLGLPEDSPGR